MRVVICFESEVGLGPGKMAGQQEGEIESRDVLGPGEMAGRQEGVIVNEDGPVRDEEERRAAGPRILQRNRLRY